ncbi:MAG: hypothetical protein ACKVHH_02920 [Candidatus Poseidoniales archaeon]
MTDQKWLKKKGWEKNDERRIFDSGPAPERGLRESNESWSDCR